MSELNAPLSDEIKAVEWEKPSEELQDRIRDIEESRTREWQPIESAPRDGEYLICHRGDTKQEPAVYAARYRGGAWWRDNNGYGFTVSCKPSFWIPLPTIPKSLAHE